MLKRLIICDRCGAEIAEAHPDRITMAKRVCEFYKDYRGIEHTKSIYKTEVTMHFCNECNTLFKAFLEGK